MKVKAFFSLVFLGFSVLIYAQNTGAPDWINNPVFIENGVILFVGYSEAFSMPRVTLRSAQSNAQKNLINEIQNNKLLKFPPIPADAKSRSIFSNFDSNGKVEGSISDILVLNVWEDDNGGMYVLCSCTGVELKQEKGTEKKAVEEMDPLELYFHALELEKQAKEEVK